MTMLLIGSQAARHWNSDFAADRKNNVQDWDVICTKKEFKDAVQKIAMHAKLVALNFESGTNKAVAKFIYQDKLSVLEASLTDVDGGLSKSDSRIYDSAPIVASISDKRILGVIFGCCIARPQLLLVLKMSHRYRRNSPHFYKTMQDIKVFRGEPFYVDTFDSLHQDLLVYRELLTYNYQHPNLKTTKAKFFTDSVPYQFDHDSIHEAVKMLDKPAYMYYIKDGEQVECSKEKFNALPHIVKLYGVLEEAYVLALERAIIPHGTDTEKAFSIALEKVCTSITSGWFREFAWEHYEEVKALYHHSFLNKFLTAQEEGRILPYTK